MMSGQQPFGPRARGVNYHLAALARVPLLAELVSEKTSLECHAERLQQLWFLYDVLERGADHYRQAGWFGAHLLDPRLDRLAASESSLAAVLGPRWREGQTALPSTIEYVEVINDTLRQPSGITFLAHHYVRYSGDAGTAELLAESLRQRADATEEMLACFRFPGIDDLPGVRIRYRQGIDALRLTPGQRDDFWDATDAAFRWSEQIFQDVIDLR